VDVKEHVIRSSRYLLLPVIRFLLKHGITWSEFGEISKEAYVKAARDDYGIQGRPTNNSRVAMMTGLSCSREMTDPITCRATRFRAF
jgi:hypothetical protein